ncbi:hypothetical protein FQZ97_1100930 [compost metagenome]
MGETTQVAQQFGAQCFVGNRHAFPHERAGFDNQFAPGLAPLPPTVVARIVSKAHEDRQRQAQQGEWRGADRVEIRREMPLDQHDQRGQQCHHQATQGNAFDDRPLEGEQHAQHIGGGGDDHGNPETAAQPPVMFMKRRICTSPPTSK